MRWGNGDPHPPCVSHKLLARFYEFMGFREGAVDKEPQYPSAASQQADTGSGIATPWNSIQPQKRRKIQIVLQRRQTLKICRGKGAKAKRPHAAGFHSQEMSIPGKSMETQSRFVGWEERDIWRRWLYSGIKQRRWLPDFVNILNPMHENS